jgi:hypothetical protein
MAWIRFLKSVCLHQIRNSTGVSFSGKDFDKRLFRLACLLADEVGCSIIRGFDFKRKWDKEKNGPLGIWMSLTDFPYKTQMFWVYSFKKEIYENI